MSTRDNLQTTSAFRATLARAESDNSAWEDFEVNLAQCSARVSLGELLSLPAVQLVIEHAAEDYDFHSTICGDDMPEVYLMGLVEKVLEAAGCTPQRFNDILAADVSENKDSLSRFVTDFSTQTNTKSFGLFRTALEHTFYEFMEFYVFGGTDKMPMAETDIRPSSIALDPAAPDAAGMRWIATHYPELHDTSEPLHAHKRVFPACHPKLKEAQLLELANLPEDLGLRYQLIASPENTSFSYQRNTIYTLGEHLNSGGALLPLESIKDEVTYLSTSSLVDLTALSSGTYRASVAPGSSPQLVHENLTQLGLFTKKVVNENPVYTSESVTIQFEEDTKHATLLLGHPVVRALVVQPTGTGKTVVFTEFLEQLHGCRHLQGQDSTLPTLIVVHTTMLGDQTREALADFAPALSTALYGENDWNNAEVVIATYSSLQRHLGKKLSLTSFGLVVFDEIHKGLGAATSSAICEALQQNPQVPALGFTATDRYSDDSNRQVQALMPQVVSHLSLIEAQARGFLVQAANEEVVITAAGNAAEIDSEGTVAPAESSKALRALLKEEAMLAVGDLLQRPDIAGKPTLVFVRKKKDAIELARFLSGFGRAVTSLTGDDKPIIAATLTDFKEGRLSVLVVTPWAFHGIDLPNASVGICVDSSQSLLDRKQMLGRLLRRDPLDPLKEALFIEFTYPELNNSSALFPLIMEQEKLLAGEFALTTNATLYSRGMQASVSEDPILEEETTSVSSPLDPSSLFLLFGENGEQQVAIDSEFVGEVLENWNTLAEIAENAEQNPVTLLRLASEAPNSLHYVKLISTDSEGSQHSQYFLSPELEEHVVILARVSTLTKTSEAHEATQFPTDTSTSAKISDEDVEAFAQDFKTRQPTSLKAWERLILRQTRSHSLDTLEQETANDKHGPLSIEAQRLKGIATELLVGLLLLDEVAIPQPHVFTSESGSFYPDYLTFSPQPTLIEVKFGGAPANVRDSVETGLLALTDSRLREQGYGYQLIHLTRNYSEYKKKGVKVVSICHHVKSDERLKKITEFLASADFTTTDNLKRLEQLTLRLQDIQARSLGFNETSLDPFEFCLNLHKDDFRNAKEHIEANYSSILDTLYAVTFNETSSVSNTSLPLALFGYDVVRDRMMPKRFLTEISDVFTELNAPITKKFLRSTLPGIRHDIADYPGLANELGALLERMTESERSAKAEQHKLMAIDVRVATLIKVVAKRLRPNLYHTRASYEFGKLKENAYETMSMANSLAVLFSVDMDEQLFPIEAGLREFVNRWNEDVYSAILSSAASLCLIDMHTHDEDWNEITTTLKKEITPIIAAIDDGSLEKFIPRAELPHIRQQLIVLNQYAGLVLIARSGALEKLPREAHPRAWGLIQAHEDSLEHFGVEPEQLSSGVKKRIKNVVRRLNAEYNIDFMADLPTLVAAKDDMRHALAVLSVRSMGLLTRIYDSGWTPTKYRKTGRGFGS